MYELKLIAQPLYNGSADKNAAFKRIAYGFVFKTCRDCCQQTAFAVHAFFARVGKQKAAGAVSVFYISVFKCTLPEKCRLLVARNAADRYSASKQINFTVNLRRRTNLRQHTFGNV